MTKTTFALIGTGIVGERIINQIKTNPNCEILSVFDENKKRLREVAERYTLPEASTLEELLETKPDWIYIGTPPVSHAPITEKAAAYGLNILSEKPLAHDAQDGERMVKAVTKANVHTAMHFPLMYSPVIHSLQQSISDGSLGDILKIELHTYFPHWPRKWQQNAWIASRAQGGFIREVFPHYLQLLYRLFGNFTITAHHTTYPQDAELCELGVSALAKTDSDIPIVLNGLSGIGQEERLEFKVFGTKKVITIRNWSELWESELDKEVVQITPTTVPDGLIEACHQWRVGEKSTLVSFEEGLQVQGWIDELLK
ncbi:MAG: Gfo/Idh/MocA family oxidoreductase [Psychrobacillus sp.]